MGKRLNTGIKKVEPSWLAKVANTDTSLEGMDEYRVLPQFKIIQATTDKELKKEFGEGSILVRPGNALVWREGDAPFLFVPQFFFVGFEKWSDLKDKDQPMVVSRTYEPTSELAKKSRNSEQRFEPYGDGTERKYRYVERLRFPGVIYGEHPFTGTPVVLSFECGEFNQGKNFISAIKLRRQEVELEDGNVRVNVPLWAQVWSFSTGFRDRGDRKWYGFEFKPAETSLIEESQMEAMQTDHEELKTLHAANRLAVDGDETESDEETVPTTNKF